MMVQPKEKKEDYLSSKQASDDSSEQLEEKSCLSEEEGERDFDCFSDGSYKTQNNKKRRREAMSTCDAKKSYKKHKSQAKESHLNNMVFDDWLFGNNRQKNDTPRNKETIKKDIEDMKNEELQRSSSSGVISFPRAQFLSRVGIFALPYTVMF